MSGEGNERKDGPIEAFFTWWSAARADIEHAYGFSETRWTNYRDPAPTREMYDPVIQKYIDAISEDLYWELAQERAGVTFTLSGFSSPELIALCSRWETLAPLPGSSKGWRFYGNAQPNTLRVFAHEGVSIDPTAFRVTSELNPKTLRVDVRIAHPTFGSLDAMGQARISVFAIHRLLGGKHTNAYIGAVVCDPALKDGEAIDSLNAQVREAFLHNDAAEAFSMFPTAWDDGLLAKTLQDHRVPGSIIASLLRRISAWLGGEPFTFQVHRGRFVIVTGPGAERLELGRRLIASVGERAQKLDLAEAFQYDETKVAQAIEDFMTFWEREETRIFMDDAPLDELHQRLGAIGLHASLQRGVVVLLDDGVPLVRHLGVQLVKRVKETRGDAHPFQGAPTMKDYSY